MTQVELLKKMDTLRTDIRDLKLKECTLNSQLQIIAKEIAKVREAYGYEGISKSHQKVLKDLDQAQCTFDKLVFQHIMKIVYSAFCSLGYSTIGNIISHLKSTYDIYIDCNDFEELYIDEIKDIDTGYFQWVKRTLRHNTGEQEYLLFEAYIDGYAQRVYINTKVIDDIPQFEKEFNAWVEDTKTGMMIDEINEKSEYEYYLKLKEKYEGKETKK